MARTYSSALKEAVKDPVSYRLGTDLANMCIKANLPAGYIAQVFDTSRQTIHTWFRGGAIRPKKRPRIEVFIQLLEEDLKKGVLPCKNLRDAKAYLRDMVGKPITKASKASD